MESVTENKPPQRAWTGDAVRVKRRGKSPPPGGQPPGHDKPHAVQGQTETPGRLPGRGRKSRTRLGYRSHARCGESAARREEPPGKMNAHRRCAFSKRPGTEFGLRPPQRGALRETGAPLAFSRFFLVQSPPPTQRPPCHHLAPLISLRSEKTNPDT